MPLPHAATVALVADGLCASYLDAGSPLPLVISPAVPAAEAVAAVARNQPFIEAQLGTHGAILFRGFAIRDPGAFSHFIEVTSGAPMAYMERTSPRTRVEGNIYTSTDYSPREPIFLHNENSYRHRFPLKIYFCCLQPPASGGETPIADCRRVYARLRQDIAPSFAGGYLYVRNFGDGPGLSWQEAFQTNERTAVEEYCREQRIAFEWKNGNRLCTRQLRRAFGRHPRTGETSWFNHLTFFHVSTLPPRVQQVLQKEFAGELPNQTYHHDGSDIAPDLLDRLRAAYSAESTMFPWQQGDVLMLDNMLTAHGRRPYTGGRRIVVGMADEFSWDAL